MRPLRHRPDAERPEAGSLIHGVLPLSPEEPALFPGESGPRPSTDPGARSNGRSGHHSGGHGARGAVDGPAERPTTCRPWFPGRRCSRQRHPPGPPARWVRREGGRDRAGRERMAGWRHPCPVRTASARCRAVRRLGLGMDRGGGDRRARQDHDTARAVAALAAGAAGAWGAATNWVASLRPSDGESQGGRSGRRVGPILVGVLALVLLAGSGRAFESAASGAPEAPIPIHAFTVGNGLQASRIAPTADLPPATSTPAPAPPSVAGAAPLQSHEIFGYAPVLDAAPVGRASTCRT